MFTHQPISIEIKKTVHCFSLIIIMNGINQQQELRWLIAKCVWFIIGNVRGSNDRFPINVAICETSKDIVEGADCGSRGPLNGRKWRPCATMAREAQVTGHLSPAVDD